MKITSTPDGRTLTVTFDVPVVTGEQRKEARKLAMRTAGTVAIGSATESTTKKGMTRLTWHVSDAALASRKVVGATPTRKQVTPAKEDATPDDTREAFLMREIARLTAELTGKGKGTAATPAKREVPAFLAKGKVTCATCRDLGSVRGVGANAGKPYRTQAGADAAKQAGRAVPCPAHKRAKRSA